MSLCNTKYVINMDDDMVWTRDTDIYNLFQAFKETHADIITMSLKKSGNRESYLGDLYMYGNLKIFCRHDYPYPPFLVPLTCFGGVKSNKQRAPLHVREQCYQTDIGYTMFLATRQFLAENPWKGLIGAEHINWFWSMKNRTTPAKVVGCLNIAVEHDYHDDAPAPWYKKLRKRPFRYGWDKEWKQHLESDDICCRLAGRRESHLLQ